MHIINGKFRTIEPRALEFVIINNAMAVTTKYCKGLNQVHLLVQKCQYRVELYETLKRANCSKPRGLRFITVAYGISIFL